MLFGNRKMVETLTKELEELKSKLSEKDARIEALTNELDELKKRELAISKALTDANLAAEGIKSTAREESAKVKEQAEKELTDAQEQSKLLTSEAEEKASKVIADAEEMASLVVSDAEDKGKDILAEAEAKSQKRLQDTEDEVRSYASILVKLNENMKEQAKLAQEASERYAAFYEQMSKSIPGIMSTISGAQLPEPKTESAGEKKITGERGNVIKVDDILTVETGESSVTTEDILNSIS